MMVNALVTGGAGFIGSHLVNELIRLGADVRVLDNLSTGFEHNLNPEASFILGDIRDEACLRKSMQGSDVIFHFAAFASVPLSFTHEEECIETNEIAFAKLLDLASRENVNKVILASSAAVYPDDADGPCSETSFTQQSSPYGRSKKYDEEILEIWCKEGLKCSGSALRYFNVYGPRQDAESDYATVVPKFIQQVLDEKPLTIYGSGHQTRDYIHVRDIVNATLFSSKLNDYNCFVVGTEEETSVIQFIEMLEEIVSEPLDRIFLPLPKGDPLSSCADITKLKLQGWNPEISFKEGLALTWESYLKG